MRSLGRLFVLCALVAATASCGDVVRQGRSSVYVVMDSLMGATGKNGSAGTFSGTLLSDVIVYDVITPDPPCSAKQPCPRVFDDFGQVILRLTSKDQSVAPTTNNQVTISRYHVKYYRADGRNTQGVDVPYEFDGGVTATVPASGTLSIGFELVRHSAKGESPLAQLGANGNLISTIADVTFYGKDQVGNDVSVTGSISINFGNFGD